MSEQGDSDTSGASESAGVAGQWPADTWCLPGIAHDWADELAGFNGTKGNLVSTCRLCGATYSHPSARDIPGLNDL